MNTCFKPPKSKCNDQKQQNRPVFVATMFIFFFLTGFLEPQHSRLEIKVESKKHQANSTEKTHFQFQIIPNKDMQITQEGPWQLTLTNVKGLKIQLKKGLYRNNQFQESIPGFSLKTERASPSVSFDYQLKSFICTLDKKRCYPEVHKGTYQKKFAQP